MVRNLSGDDLREWVSLGRAAIENYDPDLWSAMQKINRDPDAPISSEGFNANLVRFQRLFCEICDAEEKGMSDSTMPRDKFRRHFDDHLRVLEKIHQVHFDTMADGSMTAQQIYMQLVSEVFQHLIDFHINYDY